MSSILNVTPDPMNLSYSDAILINDNVKNGLKHSFELSVSLDHYKSIIDEYFTTCTIYDFSSGLDFVNHVYHEDFIIYVTGTIKEVTLVIFAKTPRTLKWVYDYFHKGDESSDVQIYLETYALVDGKVSTTSKIVNSDDVIKLNKLYYPYIDTDLLFKEFFNSHENILLLTGAPGLGKSKLAALCTQYALDNPYTIPYPISQEDPFINLVFIRGVDILASEEFWIRMEEDAPDLVIIDDLDNMLTTRDAEVQSHEDVMKNKFMNLFLSFTDGIDRNSTKFIITTNQNYKDIDKAILREGRLFDILEMRELSKEEVKNIWVSEGLPESDFPNVTTAAQLGSAIHKYKNKNTNRGYLLEENISKTSEAKAKRGISL